MNKGRFSKAVQRYMPNKPIKCGESWGGGHRYGELSASLKPCSLERNTGRGGEVSVRRFFAPRTRGNSEPLA